MSLTLKFVKYSIYPFLLFVVGFILAYILHDDHYIYGMVLYTIVLLLPIFIFLSFRLLLGKTVDRVWFVQYLYFTVVLGFLIITLDIFFPKTVEKDVSVMEMKQYTVVSKCGGKETNVDFTLNDGRVITIDDLDPEEQELLVFADVEDITLTVVYTYDGVLSSNTSYTVDGGF